MVWLRLVIWARTGQGFRLPDEGGVGDGGWTKKRFSLRNSICTFSNITAQERSFASSCRQELAGGSLVPRKLLLTVVCKRLDRRERTGTSSRGT